MTRPFFRIGFALCLCATALFAQTPVEKPEPPQTSSTRTLDLPRLEIIRDQVFFFLSEKDNAKARAVIVQALKDTPQSADLQVLRAMVLMAQGDRETAFSALEQAVARGYAGLAGALEQPALRALRPEAEKQGLIARSAALLREAPARPAGLQNGGFLITSDTLAWNSTDRRFDVRLQMPQEMTPQLLPAAPKRTSTHERAARANLNRLIRQGLAVGFSGLIYDNRDAGHSPLKLDEFPGLLAILYGPDLRREKLNYGLADSLRFDRPTIGNSSTAYKRGAAPRSLPRSAMTRYPGPFWAYQNYVSNHFYVYPEHEDHDRVDLYPANWPYMIVSQGSSYNDRPFVNAALWAMAAMKPETRAFVEAENLMAPTLQMILRRSQAHVRTPASYLSGAAHPSVFQQDAIRLDRIVALAQSLTPQRLPPVPVLEVLSDEFSSSAGLMGQSERLFNTPSAVARLWRGPEWEKEMLLKVHATGPALPEGAQFRWVLLRGDPDRVKIEPLDADASRARITLNWHDRRPIVPREKRLTDRVDIGVFIQTGSLASAPAFVSVSFPSHQQRLYAAGTTGDPRLQEIGYDAIQAGRSYDPLLYWSAPWRDVYEYDGAILSGWTRQYSDGQTSERFTATGMSENGRDTVYVLGKDQAGNPRINIQENVIGE